MVGSFDLNVVVTNGDKVGYCITLKDGLRFKESADLPLLVIVGELLLESCSCAYNGDVLLNLRVNSRKESLSTHLDPAFRSVCDYKRHLRGQSFSLLKECMSSLVKEIKRLDHVSRDVLAGVHEH